MADLSHYLLYGGFEPPETKRNALADALTDEGPTTADVKNRRSEYAQAYAPTWRDQLGAIISGEGGSSFRRLLAQRLLGTAGLGPSADPNTPWRALPVAAPAIDAAEAAYNDQHRRFAANALGVGLEAWGMTGLPGTLARTAVKPPLPTFQPFSAPIKSKTGEPIGYVSGRVEGDAARVHAAYLDEYGKSQSAANTVGYSEMRRVFDAVRELFPHTAHVGATRVSGARHGGAAADPNKLDKSRSSLEISLTPLWEQILNEAGRRGVYGIAAPIAAPTLANVLSGDTEQ